MLAVMQDRLVRYCQFSIGAKVTTGIGIAVPAREIAARDVQADTMPSLEDIARGPQIYLILVGFAGFDQRRRLSPREIAIASTDDTIRQVLGVSIRMDVYQPRHEISIGRARGRPKVYQDRTGHLDISLQHRGRIDQHVFTSLGRALIEGTRGVFRRHQERPAACLHRIGRIVGIMVKLLMVSRKKISYQPPTLNVGTVTFSCLPRIVIGSARSRLIGVSIASKKAGATSCCLIGSNSLRGSDQ